MEKRLVRSLIIERLGKVFKEHKFIWSSKYDQFIRKEDDIIYIYSLSFSKKDQHIFIRPSVKMKFKKIEEIYFKAASQKDKDYQHSIITLGNTIKQIIRHFDENTDIWTNEIQEFLIENEEDTSRTVLALENLFFEYVLRYFNNYNNIESVDKLLNSDLMVLSIHNSLYPLRACIGLITAKLIQRKDYELIKSTYSSKIITSIDEYRNNFSRLVKLLD
ncbi:MAG: hypothetical protein IPM56_03160 [Ignavibacteriales bacterium]|nr:MAG: hypothetical protein IPM56_03160 [Ignavibacteriales bacterium]